VKKRCAGRRSGRQGGEGRVREDGRGEEGKRGNGTPHVYL